MFCLLLCLSHQFPVEKQSNIVTDTGKDITCRIMAVTKVQTDIIASIIESPIGRVVILVIMYIETFKTDIIAFISNFLMYLTSH